MKHKHYDLIVQWASDPEAWVVEYRSVVTGRFIPIGFESYPEWHPETEYRLIPKRKMMHLNGVEFPAPEREAPARGTTYWMCDLLSPAKVFESQWQAMNVDRTALERGLVHLTREAAEAHARAMLAAKEVE